jgi:RHS repeat-associated protein
VGWWGRAINATFGYDANGSLTTQHDGSAVLQKTQVYDLRNRLVEVGTDGDGNADLRLQYDHMEGRVARHELGAGTSQHYLLDRSNPTGYEQVLGQAGALNVMPELAFVLAMDVVAQIDPAAAGSLASLLYDGHGSARGLVDATGRLASGQIKAYDAFGVATSGQSPILTPLGYAGEWFDNLLQQAYQRHRYLNHSTGTWNAFDGYEGNAYSPLSLHKSIYVNASPLSGHDPTGRFFTYISALFGSSVRMVLQNSHVAAGLNALDKAQTMVDAVTAVTQLVTTGTVNPALVAGLLSSLIPFGGVLGKAKLAINKGAGHLRHVADDLTDTLARLRTVRELGGTKAVQAIGDLGAISVATKMGYRPTNFPVRYHGIDGVMEQGDRLIIIEAKGGGNGALGVTKSGEQLSQDWITKKIEVLRGKGDHAWANRLQEAIDSSNLDVMHVHTPIDRTVLSPHETLEYVRDPAFTMKTFQELGRDTFLK